MSINLGDLTMAVGHLQQLEAEVAKAELELKQKNESIRIIREETIPGMLQEVGLRDVTLLTGQKVSIKQDVYASIAKADKPRAFRWLEEHNFGGMIKVDVISHYGKSEIEAAREKAKALLSEGISVELKEDVHAQTLKAFLREQISAGKNVPLDLFGARPVWTTSIK